jgi:hypothetical protein
MIKTLLVTTATISLALLSPASARPLAEPPAWAAPGVLQAQDDALSEPELRDALEVAGYTEIHILQADGDTYDMSARKDGRAVLLRVNARTRRYSERPGG